MKHVKYILRGIPTALGIFSSAIIAWVLIYFIVWLLINHTFIFIFIFLILSLAYYIGREVITNRRK